MAMNFEELEGIRQTMLSEFDREQAGTRPYASKLMTAAGRTVFPDLMRRAILTGNEESLRDSILAPVYWQPSQMLSNGRVRQVNTEQVAYAYALNEFSTLYTRALCTVLLSEGESQCQIYRAAEPKWEPANCSSHEGMIVPVQLVLDGHRAKYHPEPGNPGAFSIPFSVGCHHSIRRV